MNENASLSEQVKKLNRDVAKVIRKPSVHEVWGCQILTNDTLDSLLFPEQFVEM